MMSEEDVWREYYHHHVECCWQLINAKEGGLGPCCQTKHVWACECALFRNQWYHVEPRLVTSLGTHSEKAIAGCHDIIGSGYPLLYPLKTIPFTYIS